MSQWEGVGQRIRELLLRAGFSKDGRPDIMRFCDERRYRHTYFYRWVNDEATPLILVAFTAGCGPVLVGGGNVDQLEGAYEVCKWETIGYAFIPDLGASDTIMRNKCMREFGWVPVPGKLMGWSWVGRP